MKRFLQHSTASYLKLFTVLCFMSTVAFTGCKKFDTPVKEYVVKDHIVNNVSEKVITFIKTKKSNTQNAKTTGSNKNRNLDLLLDNLDFSKATNEALDKRTDLLVVPIKDDLVKTKNLSNSSILTLILYTDKGGKILDGCISYFEPADGKKPTRFLNNIFKGLFSAKSVAVDGSFKMLTLTGEWKSQMVIKKGKLFSAGNVKSKAKQGNNLHRRTEEGCIDWYLVTTYYSGDGSVHTLEEYITTTCDCGGNGAYATVCLPEDEGGGGGPIEEVTFEDNPEWEGQPAEDDSGPAGPGATTFLPPPQWRAVVMYSYNYKIWDFTKITGTAPYPVPPMQPFIDRNNLPATLYYSIYPGYTFFPVWAGIRSRLCTWNFISVYDYVYVYGPKMLTFAEVYKKLIVA